MFHKKWSERTTRILVLVVTVLVIAGAGIGIYLEVPWVWPGFVLGFPAGFLVGRWIRSELTLVRLIIGIAISLAVGLYSIQTSSLACISYISIMFCTVLTSINVQAKAITLDQYRRLSYLMNFTMPVMLLQVVWSIVTSLIDGQNVLNEGWMNLITGAAVWFISSMQFREAKRRDAATQNSDLPTQEHEALG